MALPYEAAPSSRLDADGSTDCVTSGRRRFALEQDLSQTQHL